MQKKSSFKGSLDVKDNQKRRQLDSGSSTHAVSQGQQTTWKIPYQVPNDASFYNGGFTLIELLVVVLIIGILAAVALPQYQKAVIKSRAAQLYTAVNAIATAAHSYELANGQWPATFDVLDIDLPLEDKTGTACGLSVGSGITKKEGKDYAVVIGQKTNTWGDIFGIFTSGDYNCTGFAYLITQDGTFDGQHLYCVEHDGGVQGRFCSKVMNKQFVQNYYGWDYFE